VGYRKWAIAIAVGLAAAVASSIVAAGFCLLLGYWSFSHLPGPSGGGFVALMLLFGSPILAMAILAWGFMIGFFVFLFVLSRF
jgi:hypothetical protein